MTMLYCRTKMWREIIIYIGILTDIYICMPVSIRTCTDLKPLYLINHVIPNRYKLPRGVSIVYDEEHRLHAYKLTEHAGNLNFPASDIFTRCSYWPEEYSVLATFKLAPDSDTPTWENGYLFSLIPQSSVHLKLGISVSRDKVTFFYSDYKIQPGKKSISFDRKLYDNQWHTIIVTVAGNMVGLRVDCGKTENQVFERTFPAYLDTSAHHIHVGNRKIQPGQFRGLLKQLLVLPGADAGQLACPAEMPSLPSISTQPDVQMMEADDPHDISYEIPYDADCKWQETGKLWYDIYSKELKVCRSGIWQIAQMTQQDHSPRVAPAPQLDYFTEHQKLIAPAAAIDIHVFSIPDEGQFVAMANYNDLGPRKQKSMLYKWVNESLQPYQNLTVYEPSSITSFTVGRHFYLAVANMRRTSARAPSEYVTIYKWHLRKKKFKAHQDLPSTQPRDVEHFEIDGDHYLAVANHRAAHDLEDAAIDYNGRSFIWKFDKKNKTFVEFQKILTTGAWDWTYFSTSSDSGEVFHFLVIANTLDNNRNVKLQSKLYYWSKQKGKVGNFYPYHQGFPTSGATDFEHFEMNGETYLAVANSVSTLESNSTSERHNTISTIYKANKERREFELFQEIPTFGIIDWEYFTIGNDSYLIASNQLAGYSPEHGLSTSARDTIIYRWKGAEKFVPTHKIQTAPTADWETLKDGQNTYLIYANGAGRQTEIYKAKLR